MGLVKNALAEIWNILLMDFRFWLSVTSNMSAKYSYTFIIYLRYALLPPANGFWLMKDFTKSRPFVPNQPLSSFLHLVSLWIDWPHDFSYLFNGRVRSFPFNLWVKSLESSSLSESFEQSKSSLALVHLASVWFEVGTEDRDTLGPPSVW